MKTNRYAWLVGFVIGVGAAMSPAIAAAPPLSAQKTTDGGVRLQWPSDAVGFGLEEADGLVPPIQWRAVTEAIVKEGGTSSVTLQPSAPTRFYRLRGGALLTTVTETSPAAGETDVSVTRETILRLSGPLGAGVTLTSGQLFAEFGGRRLLARAELSGDRRTLTLFYLENLPSGGQVKVGLVGDGLRDDRGQDLDADGDGQPGGTLELRFVTAGTTGLPGTAVIGHVFSSERKGDGSNRPLEGVIVTVDGAEESLRALTDANGFFTLQPAPAGRFFVHVDGRSAVGSQWPGGAYYPFVGKSWEAVAGRTNNLAAGTGEIFLPLIQADALEPVSATEETTIGFSPSVLAANPSLAGVELRVPPNSLFSENGTRGGRVGIAPVPPDRLPEPLPPGLNLPLVITIQTDGPQNFDRPVPVRFPNLPDPVTGVKLPPGAKTVLWSFNHDTGRWEPQGTATISADGNFAETDPGVGVRQPGWNGVSPGTRGRRHRGGESPRLPGQPPRYGKPPRPEDPPQPPCDPGFHYSYDCDKDGCPDHFQPCDCDRERDEYNRILEYCRYDKIFRNAVSQITCSFDNSCPDPAWAKKWITCRRELNEALATWRACKARVGIDSEASGRGEVALQSPTPSADDQERLAAAGAAVINLVLGAPAWTDLDPGLPDSAFDTVVALGTALAESSPGGRTITPEEQALVANASRPPNVTPAMVQTAIQRLNALQAGTLPLAERQQIEQASAAYTTMFAELEAQGWKTPLDGLLGEEAATSTAAARLAWETFIDGRRQYYVIRNPENGFEQRGRLDESGEFENVILPADSYLRIEYLDPVTLFAGTAVFRSAPAGSESRIPVAPMWSATERDADGDGVADALESIVGTNPNLADTDGDGVGDGEELRSGSNPLDGQPSALGVIAGLSLPGSALVVGVKNEVAVVGMALGSGVAFVDVRQPTEPVLVAVSKTPGQSTGVAFTGSFAAVAAGTSGVALFDLSDRTQPRYLRQIPGDAKAIAASGGRLYFGSGTRLDIVPTDGTSTATFTLPEALDDLQAFDGFLYVLTKTQLRVYAIDGRNVVARGSVPVDGPAAPLESGRKLFVGGRHAYVGSFEGWRVVDVGNPDAPVVVGRASRTQSAVHALVFDGRQLLAVTSFSGPETLAVSVYDATNPTSVTNLLTTFDTPGAARSVALHRGYGLVADTAGGLTVLNYRARDRGTNPPSVTLRARLAHADPPTHESGALFTVVAETDDDVLVRSVAFYVDDQLVASDTSYPFEVEVRAPLLTDAKRTFELHAQAFDTAGSATTSQTLTIHLAPDLTPPGLLSVTPPPDTGFLVGTTVDVSVLFNEPVVTNSLNTGFTLIHVGADGVLGTADDVPVPTAPSLAGVNEYALNFHQPLSLGTYAVKLGTNLSDAFGNHLATEESWRFRIQPLITFVGGGDPVWNATPRTSTNWSAAALPTTNDFVRIATSNNAEVRVAQQANALELTTSTPLSFESGAILLLGRRATFEGPVILQGGTWQGGDVVFRGDTRISRSLRVVDQNWVNEGHVVMSTDALLNLRNSTGRRTILRNSPGALWEMVDSQMTATISGAVDFENQGLLVARGTNRNSIDTSRFVNLGAVEVREGTMDIGAGDANNGPSQHLGSYRVDAGAELRFTGLSQFGRASRIFGGGNVKINSTVFPGSYESDGGTSVGGTVTFSGPVHSRGTWRTGGGHAFFTGLNPEITGHVLSEGAITVAAQPQMRLNSVDVFRDLTVTTALEVNGPLLLDSTVTPSGSIAAARLLGPGRLRANGPLRFAGIVNSLGLGTLEVGGTAACRAGTIMQFGASGYAIQVLSGGTFDVSGAQRISPRGLFFNEGTLLKTNTTTTQLTAPVRNSGTVRVAGGTLEIVNGNFIQTAGLLSLTGGNLSVHRAAASAADVNLVLQGGTLEGVGVITAGSVTNLAEIAPGSSVGRLEFQVGDHPVYSVFQQTATGKLTFDIAGPAPGTEHDQVQISGRALLDGRLDIRLDPTYDPPVGQEFTILTCLKREGTFAEVIGAALPNGKHFEVSYTDTGVKLRVVP